MPLIKGIVRAIQERWSLATSLDTQFTGKLWINQSPHRVEKPYATFHLLSGLRHLDGFSGNHHIEYTTVQFSLFDRRPQANVLLGFADLVLDRFDWAPLVFSEPGTAGWTSLLCVRMSLGTLIKDPTDAWMYVVRYNVRYQTV